MEIKELKPDPDLISYIEKGFTPEILPDSWIGKIVNILKGINGKN